MIYLISPDKKQYKANLHCHSVLSDGKKTPGELKEMYKSHGYSVLAITDHERPCEHQELSDDDIIMLTGYEAYIRQNPDGVYNPFNKEIHLNLFAKDPKNVKMICCNEHYCHYLKRDNAFDRLERVGTERLRELTKEYVDEFIRTAREHGYLVAYNHPYWSMQSESEILSYDGLFSIEMCNYGSYLLNHLEYNGALYDKLLLAGKRIFCHSADDNHNHHPEGDPNCDSFGAFTMLMPSELTYDGVIRAMENGDMYSSMGPTFSEVSVNSNNLHIECSEVEHIFMYFGSKQPCRLHAKKGEKLTSADFTIQSQAKYVRVSIQDSNGNWADTRGFSREELGL